jgi:hypothetical protein
MLKKATAQSSSSEQRTSKGNRRQIFGFVEGHIAIENLQSQFFSKNERFFKMYVMELRKWLF